MIVDLALPSMLVAVAAVFFILAWKVNK